MAKNKKNSSKKEAKPMPSLIFNEGLLQDSEPIHELPQEEPTEEKIEEQEKIVISGYNPKAKKLMWLGVVFVTVIICALWGWSLSVQWTSANWSSEKDLINNTVENWEKAFSANETTNDELKNQVKENLKKLMVGTSTSTVETVNNFPTSSPTTSTLLN